MQYTYHRVGAIPLNHTPGNHQYSFTVWAPEQKNVEILLHNNNKSSIPLQQDERGFWKAVLGDVAEGTLYTYRLGGGKEFPDPASRWQPQGVHGPSAVVPGYFEWADHEWKGMPLREMIIYELHVGTFTSAQTFDGVITKLPYLKELGINTIELMPVAQFPGSRNWGYDGVFPFAVQHSYGGATGLKRLVNEAHRSGIAVILDVVYNHLGPEGNYFGEFGPYFSDKYKTFWGSAINFDNAYCDAVRQFFIQNACMWLDEFHIDGLRMDAVHAIWDFSARHFIEELVEQVRRLERQSGRRKILIAELDLNNPRYINPPERGGYGMDGQWIDEFHHALHALITGETDGYYEDFGKVEHLKKAFTDSYVYTGEYSAHRKKNFGVSARKNRYSQFVVFAQNHDQVGNRLLGDRLTHHLSFEALKLTAATVLLSPHVPLLFMGEEYGEKNPFQYFISHTDKELVEMVRKGRKEEFSYFNWKGEVPDPQSEETFRQCILSYAHEKDEQAAALFRFYQHLIRLRKEHPALQSDAREALQLADSPDKVIAFTRHHENRGVLIVLNFNPTTVTMANPAGTALEKILDSSAVKWMGNQNESTGILAPGDTLTLAAESMQLYELR